MYYYRIISIILFAVGITFSLTPSVYAEESISISTSQSLYNEGDTVVVFGTIAKTFQGLPITLQIYHEDNLIAVAQVEVALDGSFAKDFSASGPFWTSDGIYIVRGFYTSDKIVETTFEFYKQVSIVGSTSFPVDIPNSGTFDMGYTIRGGEIKDVTINKDHNSLLLELAAESSGELVVKLPRSSFDAIKSDGGDEIFIVLIGNNKNDLENFVQVQYKEVETGSDFRSLRILFEKDDRWIEIIGTYVIPEFGSIAIIILVAAVSSAIIISKSKLSVRYN